MKSPLALGCLCLLLVGVSGCGGNADSLMKQQVGLMNDMADALENGASEDKVTAIQTRMKKNAEKLEKLDLSAEQKRQLIESHKDDMQKALSRMQTAMMSRAMEEMGKSGKGMPAMPGFGAP